MSITPCCYRIAETVKFDRSTGNRQSLSSYAIAFDQRLEFSTGLEGDDTVNYLTVRFIKVLGTERVSKGSDGGKFIRHGFRDFFAGRHDLDWRCGKCILQIRRLKFSGITAQACREVEIHLNFATTKRQ